MLEDFDLKVAVEPLLAWYQLNKRSLPWREQVTPYRVWVSEIMLQQTRVEAVKPYYARFMEALPDIKDLAECPEEKLLKLWEGLGYYNRVRNMQIAAQTVMEQFGGEIPADYEQILSLKGIGSYTAGAIASIAYGLATPAVDGNVLRVIMRLTEDDSDIMKQSTKTKVEQVLSAVMLEMGLGRQNSSIGNGSYVNCTSGCKKTEAGDVSCNSKPTSCENPAGNLNQALMELGATVCVPNGAPHCDECPWQEFCLANKNKSYDRLPVKTKAKARRIEQRTILIVRDGEHVVLEKRPAKGLLAGMYQFLNLDGILSEEEALKHVQQMGLHPMRIQKLEDAVHIFSHVEWHMSGYMIQVDSLTREESEIEFVEIEKAQKEYAIPSAFAAYTRYLDLKLGVSKEKKID